MEVTNEDIEKIKEYTKMRFPPGRHQLCYLYDLIMEYMEVDGLDGEEVARNIMLILHNDQFLEVQPCMFGPDMFETVW